MATTIHPPEIEQRPDRFHDHGGNGHIGNVGRNGESLKLADYSSEPSRTGIWVALAAISMTFAAFTSALVVRQATANDWKHLALPPILFMNTIFLLASSGTLEMARQRVAAFARGLTTERNSASFGLSATLGLGMLFVAGQYFAWRQLRAQGFYLASNPNSSFFYVLTAAHALHVLGGLAGLLRVNYLFHRPVLALRRSTLDATSYYWHFMGVLWLYVLLVMWIKL